MDLTVSDLTALTAATLLLFNAAIRMRRTTQNRGLLRANLAMVLVLLCSVSVVFYAVDPLLGSRSLLNCITHLLMVYTGWEVSAATAKMLSALDKRPARPRLVQLWVPIVSALGVVGSYLLLNPSSSRGLEEYDQEIAYVLYWVFSVLPVALGAVHLVPRLAEVGPLLRETQWRTTTTLILLWLSFIGVLLCVAAYATTAARPELYVAREIIVTGTLLLFTAAFMMATAALPRRKERQSQRTRRARTPTQPH